MNPESNQAINTDDDETSSAKRANEVSMESPIPAARTPAQPQRATSGGASSSASAQQTEMKRTAAKELIERYFFQLQRGCGNPLCSNKNCASSGQVPPMDATEIAINALQLFKLDAKLCDLYNSQPPKATCPQNDSSSVRYLDDARDDGRAYSKENTAGAMSAQQQDADMLSPNENSTSSSSSGNSTITSGSSRSATSRSTTSSTSSSTTTTTNSTNTNLSGCAADEVGLDVLSSGGGGDGGGETAAASAALGAAPRQKIHKSSTSKKHSHSAKMAKDAAAASATATRQNASDPPTPTLAPVAYLDEQLVDELLAECVRYNSYDRLLHAIHEVYSNVEKLGQSYRRRPRLVAAAMPTAAATANVSAVAAAKLQELLGKSPSELKKEDLRMLEGENEKDEDSTCATPTDDVIIMEPARVTPLPLLEPMDEDELVASGGGGGACALGATALEPIAMDVSEFHLNSDYGGDTTVDLESLRRVRSKLCAHSSPAIAHALNYNIILLAETIRYHHEPDWDCVLHCLVICFDMASNTSNRFADLEYLEDTLPQLCHAVRILPVAAQARLARIWATHCKGKLRSLVQSCQQLITLQVILSEETIMQYNKDVVAITKVLQIAFYASLLAGQLERPAVNLPQAGDEGAGACAIGTGDDAAGIDSIAEEDDIFNYTQVPKLHNPNKLERELKISTLECRVPLVPYEDFYNEPLSEAIHMDRDYLCYRNLAVDPKSEELMFSFMVYSFILTPATKVVALYYDSRIRMYSERNASLYAIIDNMADESAARPDLKLKVRRENLIDDALIGLEMVAMSNPKDLKKQLVVEFVGEQGIDEGGVSKEFFQLIVEEIFNPDIGMFTHQDDTNTMWFNSMPFENGAQFTLIGIIIGLAIYNNIILAVNFPMVVYRKLMGGKGTFDDLADWNPTLHRSLQSLLDYEGQDFEDVFMQTFKISYKNVFDELIDHELIPGGSDIAVGQHNKQEFVDLYSDFLLNRSIDRQFTAFQKGFEMVTDESPLKLLFRPEEIELLVCGSRQFDFIELERSTEYEGGYTRFTTIIKDFWQIVHAMPEMTKRKLLEFTTGSDRVPVGGLSRLKMLITRHGPDSERLPTSHTCFNVLLLPEYSSKEKLEERLLKAITYSKGFGML